MEPIAIACLVVSSAILIAFQMLSAGQRGDGIDRAVPMPVRSNEYLFVRACSF
jgi:hypothetical protein